MRVVEVKGVPAAAQHYAARVLAGNASVQDVKLWEEHVDKDKRAKEMSGRLAVASEISWSKRCAEKLSDARKEVIWKCARLGEVLPFRELAKFEGSMKDLISVRDKKRRTPLHIVCKYGHLDCLRICLEIPPLSVTQDTKELRNWRITSGVHTSNVCTLRGYTPFHYAIASGHLRCVEHMLNYFALLETTEAEICAKAERQDAATLAANYEWNGIRQLLVSIITPIQEKKEQIKLNAFRAEQARKEKETAEREAAECRERKEQMNRVEMDKISDEDCRRKAEEGKQRIAQNSEDGKRLILMHEKHLRHVNDMQKETQDYLEKLFMRRRKSSDSEQHQKVDKIQRMAGYSYMGNYDDLNYTETEVEEIVEEGQRKMSEHRKAIRKSLRYPKLGICVSEGVSFGMLGLVHYGGVRVRSVMKSSPASNAELKEGDLIVAVNDIRIKGFEDLQTALQENGLEALHLIIQQNGKERCVVVTPMAGSVLAAPMGSLKTKAAGVLWSEKPVETSRAHSAVPWFPSGSESSVALHNNMQRSLSPPLVASRVLSPIRDRVWHTLPPRPLGPPPVSPQKAAHESAWSKGITMDFDKYPKVDFREQYDGKELKRFYDTFMKVNFPIEDELDPLEVWEEVLDPERVEGSMEDMPVNLHVVVVYEPSEGDGERKIIGGVVFEYYKMSNACLMSYFAVAEEYRKHGLGKWLIGAAWDVSKQASQKITCEGEAKASYSKEEWISRISRLKKTDKNKQLLEKVVALCTDEEIDALNAVLISHDVSASLGLLFAETNSESLLDAVMDPKVRHRILHKMGFKPLNFGYIQPPLSDDQNPCYDLLLLTLQSAPANTLATIPSVLLKLFLLDFSVSVFGSIPSFTDADWYKQMDSELSSLKGVVAQHGSPPWEFCTPKPEGL